MIRFILPLVTALFAGCVGNRSPAPAEDAPKTSSASASPAPANTSPEKITAAELMARMEKGKLFIVDVRTPEEYRSGHVPGAINLPLPELSSRMSELASHAHSDVYVICEAGARSARATEMLAQAGFDHLHDVRDGTRAWRQADYPLEK